MILLYYNLIKIMNFNLKNNQHKEKEIDFLDDINNQLQQKLRKTKSVILENNFEFKKILNGFIKENQLLDEKLDTKDSEIIMLNKIIDEKNQIIEKNELRLNDLEKYNFIIEKNYKIIEENLKENEIHCEKIKLNENYVREKNSNLENRITKLIKKINLLESENLELKSKCRFSKSVINVENRTSVHYLNFEKKKFKKEIYIKDKSCNRSKAKENKNNVNLREGIILDNKQKIKKIFNHKKKIMHKNKSNNVLEPLKLLDFEEDEIYSIDSDVDIDLLSKSIFSIRTKSKIEFPKFEKNIKERNNRIRKNNFKEINNEDTQIKINIQNNQIKNNIMKSNSEIIEKNITNKNYKKKKTENIKNYHKNKFYKNDKINNNQKNDRYKRILRKDKFKSELEIQKDGIISDIKTVVSESSRKESHFTDEEDSEKHWAFKIKDGFNLMILEIFCFLVSLFFRKSKEK